MAPAKPPVILRRKKFGPTEGADVGGGLDCNVSGCAKAELVVEKEHCLLVCFGWHV